MLDNSLVDKRGLDDLTFLVVDDDEDICRVLEKYLKLHGASVATCQNGLTAYQALKSMDFDFVLTDINMPQMNGIELLDKVNNSGQIATKFIVMSGGNSYSADEVLDKCAIAYIEKPFVLSQVKELILTHLN